MGNYHIMFITTVTIIIVIIIIIVTTIISITIISTIITITTIFCIILLLCYMTIINAVMIVIPVSREWKVLWKASGTKHGNWVSREIHTYTHVNMLSVLLLLVVRESRAETILKTSMVSWGDHMNYGLSSGFPCSFDWSLLSSLPRPPKGSKKWNPPNNPLVSPM